MNKSKKFARALKIIFALAAGIFFIPRIHAQLSDTNIESRFLFIFDTSSDMKKRLPMTEKALDTMLATSIRGGLHTGDSIGLWTFNQTAQMGEFPMQFWDAGEAADIASKIDKFVREQHYSRQTKFSALEPWLNEVVENSPRLTVLIFCDGETPINITPFDAGINQIFQQKQAEQKKARQPFIIVMRSQLGQYVYGSVYLPPETVALPDFPPWPTPKPTPAAVAPAPPKPVVTNPPQATLPPLIIVGTKVETSLPPANIVVTNVPKHESSAPPDLDKTNVASVQPRVSSALTNKTAPEITVVETNVILRTNEVIVSSDNSEGGKGLFAIGAAFLVAAIGLIIFAVRRARKTGRESLISSSMNRRK